MTNDFHDVYRKLSTAELLQIVAEKEGYQPEAIAAATEILQSREVTADDEQSLETMQQEQAAVLRKRESRRVQMMKLWDAVRPDKKKSLKQKFFLLFGFLIIACLFRQYDQLRRLIIFFPEIISGTHVNYYGGVIGTLFDLTLSVTMLYLYFRRYKAGWTLAAVLSTLFFVGAIQSFLLCFKLLKFGYSPIPFFIKSITSLLLNGISLYMINTVVIKRVFSVSPKWQMRTVLISAVGFFIIYLTVR